MRHSFEVSVAAEYGVNAAILLDEIGHWVKLNEANRTHYHDGNYWTFNSRRAYRELFPYMSERQINTAFEKLISAGLIVTGNYNQNAYDRTLWYALTQKGKSILHYDIMDTFEAENRFAQNGEPIPTPNTTPNTTPKPLSNTTAKSRRKRESVLPQNLQILFDRFWEVYPKKVAKENAEKAWKKINPSEELASTIVQAVKTQISVDGRFRETRFTPHPATWLNGHEWENSYEKGTERRDDFKPSTGFRTDF